MDITWPADWDAFALIYVYFICAWLFYRIVLFWPIQKIKQILGL